MLKCIYLFIFCLEFSAVINSVFSVLWTVRNNDIASKLL